MIEVAMIDLILMVVDDYLEQHQKLQRTSNEE